MTGPFQPNNNPTRRILIFLGLTLVLSLFFPGGKSLEYDYELGDITREEIVAQFNFPILKDEEKLKADVEEAVRNVPFLFEKRQEIVDRQIQEIGTFMDAIEHLQQVRKQYGETQQLLWEHRYDEQYEKIHSKAVTDSAAVGAAEEALQTAYPFDLSEPEWVTFLDVMQSRGDDVTWEGFEDTLINICRNRWAEGILDIRKEDIKSTQVAVIMGDVPELMEIKHFNDLEEAWYEANVEITNAYPSETFRGEEDNILRKVGYRIILEFMKPNLIFDSETTERRQEDAIAKVPRSHGIVRQNERIVDAHTEVTREILQKLKSYAHELDKRERLERGLALILPWLGRFILVGIILSFFFNFLRTYRRALFRDNRVLLLFGSVFLLMGAISYLVVFTIEWPEYLRPEYLIPITVLAMVITVLFDARIAVMATVTLAILIGFMIGNKLDFVIVSLFTSIAAVLAVRKLRARAQLFSAILYIVISGLLAITALAIIKRAEWVDFRYDFLFITVSGILAPFITFGLSALFEIAFGVTSDLTLLELSDFNHPLLKRLSQEANGTFNHSVVVGNMAESCASAVGANPLLCRVGAYYHDIGKLTRPEYFVENQFTGENKHDKLSPSLSARVLANHVKDGLKLAKEYRLPPDVSDFVPMHHGTSRIEYFYQKALDQTNGDVQRINESDFRYSGPRPNTRETGIVMICESVEAAVRSIKNPNIHNIEVMVSRVIEKNLQEGQLDNCPLTMRDLAKLRGDVRGGDGLLPVLRGIYHLRIEYPNQKIPPASRTASA